MNFDLHLNEIITTIQENHFTRILIQMPDGMLDKPLKTVLHSLKELNIEIMVSGDPSYGVCDLAVDKAKQVNADLLIHFGHSPFGFQKHVQEAKEQVNILLVPAYVKNINLDYPKLFEKLKKLNWEKVGLTSTIQYLPRLVEVQQNLNQLGFKALIPPNGGQIIGCHIGGIKPYFNEAEVDGVLSVHPGVFHTNVLLFKLPWDILQIDPHTNDLNLFTREIQNTLIKKRLAVIENARSATTWGILGSTKIGQYNQIAIKKVQEILTNENKIFSVILAENLNPEHLTLNFNWVNAWINTACPRIALDDALRYQRPILSYHEFLYLFDQLPWERLLSIGFM